MRSTRIDIEVGVAQVRKLIDDEPDAVMCASVWMYGWLTDRTYDD